jgi:hypothetical protein
MKRKKSRPTRSQKDRECLIQICTFLRGDQEGLFKLVTLNCILNRITGVTFGC